MFSVPLWDDGDTITCNASAAITGGTFVKVAGARVNGLIDVATCAAGDAAFGVAAHDAATGDIVTVHHATEIVAPVTAGAALTAGQKVESDASGNAIVFTGTAGHACLGTALDTVASGAQAPIDRQMRG